MISPQKTENLNGRVTEADDRTPTYHGNALQEIGEFFAKMPSVLAGKLIIDCDDDELPRSRSSTMEDDIEPVYHGNALQEISEFFSKMPSVLSGKLVVDDDDDELPRSRTGSVE